MMYEGWRVLFKLCFAAYICHYLVIFWYYASIHSNGRILGRWEIMRCTFGALVISFVIGFVFYLLIDKPIRNLDRLVLFPSKLKDSFLIKKTAKAVNSQGKMTLKSGGTFVLERGNSSVSADILQNIRQAEEDDV